MTPGSKQCTQTTTDLQKDVRTVAWGPLRDLYCKGFEEATGMAGERSSVEQRNSGSRGDFPSADEVRYMQRRAAQRQSRIVTIGQFGAFLHRNWRRLVTGSLRSTCRAPGPGWRSAIGGDRDTKPALPCLERKVPDRWSRPSPMLRKDWARPHHPGYPTENRSQSRIAKLPEADR